VETIQQSLDELAKCATTSIVGLSANSVVRCQPADIVGRAYSAPSITGRAEAHPKKPTLARQKNGASIVGTPPRARNRRRRMLGAFTKLSLWAAFALVSTWLALLKLFSIGTDLDFP
jgi:hypothetical protein